MDDYFREKAVFLEALDVAEGERAAFLEGACAGWGAASRARVEAMLAASGSGFLDEPTFGGHPDGVGGSLEGEEVRCGGRVYRVGKKIGEGGYGVVYEAEQEEPVRRRVALKVLKFSSDDPASLARFENEKQTLAKMQHPNIAQVYDAGRTPGGFPYVAMELIGGEPITRYCDGRRLGFEARLRLFADVCRAVHHAHQKAVIHRDLKPSNILVSEEDGRALAKVIDFGVAVGGEAWEGGEGRGGFVGTPSYMSPEQAAAGAGGEVDARSDLYSLGVVLFELVAGSTPVGKGTLDGKSVAEIETAVAESGTVVPSARLESATVDVREGVAAVRGLKVARLLSRVRGDLDAVVGKALRRRPEDRYESAAALARDVELYLEDRLVTAGEAGVWMRLKKFCARNRTVVASSTAVTAGLVVAVVGMLEAQRQGREAALEELRVGQLDELLETMFLSADPHRLPLGDDSPPRAMLDSMAVNLDRSARLDPEVETNARRSLARAYHGLGAFDEAEAQFGKAIALASEHGGEGSLLLVTVERDYGWLKHEFGDYLRALRLIEPALGVHREVHGDEHRETLHSIALLADLKMHLGAYAESERLARSALEVHARLERRGEDRAKQRLWVTRVLARNYRAQNRMAEAEAVTREILEIAEEKIGADHPWLINDLHALAAVCDAKQAFEESEAIVRRALAIAEARLGVEHPTTAYCRRRVGENLMRRGRLDEAKSEVREAMAVLERTVGGEALDTLSAKLLLADLAVRTGEVGVAEVMCLEAIDTAEAAWGREHRIALRAQGRLAVVRLAQNRTEEALDLGEATLESWKRSPGDEAISRLQVMRVCVEALNQLGKREEAGVFIPRAVAAHIEALGADHPSTFDCQDGLMDFYQRSGRFGEAVDVRRETVEGRKRVLGARHAKTLRDMRRQAMAYRNLGRLRPAKAQYLEWVEAGPEGVEKDEVVRDGMGFLAMTCRDLRHFEDGMRVQEQLLAMARRQLPEGDGWLRRAERFLGVLERGAANPGEGAAAGPETFGEVEAAFRATWGGDGDTEAIDGFGKAAVQWGEVERLTAVLSELGDRAAGEDWGDDAGRELVLARGLWRFNDGGGDAGFDTSKWREGRGPLGARHPMVETRVGTRRSAPEAFTARQGFEVEGEFEALKLRVFCDVECVVFLNEVEVFRADDLGGESAFSAVFPRVVQVSPARLKAGRNVLSAEVRRDGNGPERLLFDAALVGR